MKLQELKLGYDSAVIHSDNWYTAIGKCASSPLEDMWGRLVKSVEDNGIKSTDLIKPVEIKSYGINDINIIKDRNNMNILDKIKIVKIEEETKVETVKVPQYKAAPKLKEKTYKIVKVTFASGHIQEAVCLPEDIDNYELLKGVELCIIKELFGSTKIYNTFLHKTLKDHKKRIEEENKKKKQQQEDEKIVARRKAKNEKRKADLEAKKKEAERQEKIEIQAQAILKALKMYDAFVVQEDAQNLDQLIQNEINE